MRHCIHNVTYNISDTVPFWVERSINRSIEHYRHISTGSSSKLENHHHKSYNYIRPFTDIMLSDILVIIYTLQITKHSKSYSCYYSNVKINCCVLHNIMNSQQHKYFILLCVKKDYHNITNINIKNNSIKIHK